MTQAQAWMLFGAFVALVAVWRLRDMDMAILATFGVFAVLSGAGQLLLYLLGRAPTVHPTSALFMLIAGAGWLGTAYILLTRGSRRGRSKSS